MAIHFHLADVKFNFSDKRKVAKFLQSEFFLAKNMSLNLNIVFCSDDFLLQINKQFLQHDYYTDIITFPIEESDKKMEAEIYISTDRVKENSIKQNTDFSIEMLRVIFHGVLHLTGLKDKTKEQQQLMRMKEDEWIEKFLYFKQSD